MLLCSVSGFVSKFVLANINYQPSFDIITSVVGFLGYPQPGGGAHPPIPSEGVLGEVLGD